MALPKFLQPEAVLFASLEILQARLTDSQPARVICAWCPDFDGLHPSNRGASHGMCPSCAALFDQAIEAEREEDARGEELHGSTCGAACGFCGMCS